MAFNVMSSFRFRKSIFENESSGQTLDQSISGNECLLKATYARDRIQAFARGGPREAVG